LEYVSKSTENEDPPTEPSASVAVETHAITPRGKITDAGGHQSLMTFPVDCIMMKTFIRGSGSFPAIGMRVFIRKYHALLTV
jgi:hypothetical protein